jgi:hypothetical protein
VQAFNAAANACDTSVLAPSISRDAGWSIPQVTAAFSLALVTSAMVGLRVGRRLDRQGPLGVMIARSLLGVAALRGIVRAPNLVVFMLVGVGVGVGAGARDGRHLYPPASTALTQMADS